MLPKISWDLPSRVLMIGGLHSVVLVWALFDSIKDMVLEQQPVVEEEIMYIVAHMLLQVTLITLLVCGAIKKKPWLVVPWLVVTFPVFAVVSFYTLKFSNLNYVFQMMTNVVFIGGGWFLWVTVYQFCKSCGNLDHRNVKL